MALTKVNASNIIDGVLPVANGGTGASSYTATQWTTTGSNIYYNTGNVGVGTSSPYQAKLDVKGVGGTGSVANIGATNSNDDQLLIGSINRGSSPAFFSLPTGSAFVGAIGNGVANTLGVGTYGAAPLVFGTSNTERMRLSAAGGLSIGTTADPGAGAIYATGNITAYYSDDRLKTKLGGIENALDKVKSLSGFYYEANQTAQDLGYQAVREVGVSAQQVQAVMPEVVKPAPIDQQYLTVDYERLVPLLIEAIKELEEKVAKLEAK